MTGRRTPSAIAQTARRSPSDALGNPASITSTPSVSSWRARRSFSSAVIELPGACSPSRKVVSKMMTSLPMGGSRAPCLAWMVKKSRGPSRVRGAHCVLLVSLAAHVLVWRAPQTLSCPNAQQDQDQKQDQRELHHESMSLQIGTVPLRCDRTRTIRLGPTTVKAGRLRALPVRVGGSTGSSARKLNQRDLGRRAQAERRPPIARAPAHVQPHRLQPVEPRDERLEQSHQQVERKVLPAVRVPRELQVVPDGAGRERALRLMRQQHTDVALRRSRDRRRRIGGVPGKAAAREVRDPGDDDPTGPPADYLVSVHEGAEAEPLQLAHPPGRVPVVLVVARNEV